MIYFAGSGHPGGSLSAADMMTALYFHEMRIDPAHPDWPDRDRFILSKGHACPIWYAALAERGYFPVDDLWGLRQTSSHLQGHPDMRKTPGVEMTSGPLGSGLSAGLGMALGARITGQDFRTFVMLGEGDLQEGATWEAAMVAAQHKLSNLIVLVDYNRSQVDGKSDDIVSLDPLPDKWRACRWAVTEIDGRDMGRDSRRAGLGACTIRKHRRASSPTRSKAGPCRSCSTIPSGTARRRIANKPSPRWQSWARHGSHTCLPRRRPCADPNKFGKSVAHRGLPELVRVCRLFGEPAA